MFHKILSHASLHYSDQWRLDITFPYFFTSVTWLQELVFHIRYLAFSWTDYSAQSNGAEEHVKEELLPGWRVHSGCNVHMYPLLFAICYCGLSYITSFLTSTKLLSYSLGVDARIIVMLNPLPPPRSSCFARFRFRYYLYHIYFVSAISYYHFSSWKNFFTLELLYPLTCLSLLWGNSL